MTDLRYSNVPDDIMDIDFWLKNYKDIALLDAAHNKNVNIAKSLLQKGANPDYRFRGEYVMKAAIHSQCFEMVELLLQSGASVNPPMGTNALLILAIREGDAKIIELLLKAGLNPNIDIHWEKYPLIIAAQMANVKATELLLKYGADPNAVTWGTWGGDTPLLTHYQSMGGPVLKSALLNHLECKKILIEHGADVNARYEHPMTGRVCLALRTFNDPKDRDIFILLLENGADPNLVCDRGRTALHSSVRSNFVESVKLLLKYNTNLDIQDNNGETALMLAAQRNDIGMVGLLLDHNANPNLLNNDNKKAIDLTNDEAIKELLTKQIGKRTKSAAKR